MSIQSVLFSLTETSRSNQIDVAQGFSNNNYIKKYKQDVPVQIVLIIAIFSSRLIPFGNFPLYITMKEDLKFVQILQQTLGFKIASFKSKFKASNYNFATSKFHQLCNKNSSNGDLILMKSKIECIFGGYTTESWKLDEMDKNKSRVVFDSRSFIFIVRYDNNDIIPKSKLPTILLPKRKEYTPIISAREAGPMFGLNDIMIGFDGKCGYSRLRLYANEDLPQLTNICGGNTKVSMGALLGESNVEVYKFELDELEVFEVLKKKS